MIKKKENLRSTKRILLEDDVFGDEITISDTQKLHHLLNVTRVKVAEKIRVFNEQEGEWESEIIEIKNKRHIKATVIKKIREAEKKSGIKIAFASIKLERLKLLLEKCTEIGGDAFMPLITERCVVRDVNIDKLKPHIVGAVEQSERITVPLISEPLSLEKFLADNKEAQIIFCNEMEISKPINSIKIGANSIILIGPEGGFTENERNMLLKHANINSVFLTRNILRSETAAIFALSCLISKTNYNEI